MNGRNHTVYLVVITEATAAKSGWSLAFVIKYSDTITNLVYQFMAVVAAVAGRNSQNTTSTCGGSVFLCDRHAHRGRHALHQWHLRTTWRQALSLLHLRVRQLKVNGTEVRRMHILAVGRGFEGGGGSRWAQVRLWRAVKSHGNVSSSKYVGNSFSLRDAV